MMTRSVFTLIAAAAFAVAAPGQRGGLPDVKAHAAAICMEADNLEAIASMQNLDWRSHQTQLGNLKAAVNSLGQELAGSTDAQLVEGAREVAALVTQAIEILNDHTAGILPPAYKETAKKLSAAADKLQREVKSVSARSASE